MLWLLWHNQRCLIGISELGAAYFLIDLIVLVLDLDQQRQKVDSLFLKLVKLLLQLQNLPELLLLHGILDHVVLGLRLSRFVG